MNAPEKIGLPAATPGIRRGLAPASGAAGVSRPHESARAQVSGSATYVDDITELRGTLYAAPILSNVAHGRLLRVDIAEALAMPGVRGVVVAADIPGDGMLASFAGDEPIFATDMVQHIGQVVNIGHGRAKYSLPR